MRLDWVYGLGALWTLGVLVGIDLLVALVEQRGTEASFAILRELRAERPRRD
jgi:hypothetical protein